MNDTVIVTVSGDRAEETLEADRAQPVGRLLAGWARRCSSLPPARLAVVADDGDPLDPESTLAGAGACYGTTLRLVEQPMKPTRAPDVVIVEEPPPSLLHAASSEQPGGPGGPETDGHNGSVNHALARGDGLPEAPEAVAGEATGSTDPATPAAAAGDQGSAVPALSDPTPAGGTEPVGLPRRVGWARRRAAAAASAVSQKPLLPAEAYAVAERPGPLSRWRRQMAATDYLAQLEQLVRRAVIGESVLIAVVSPKGGVGKTTLTGLLAELRRDPVLALDANADFGNLAARLCPPEAPGDTVAQLWSWAQERSVTPAALAGRLGQGPHGLRVIGTPDQADAMLAAADHGLYQAVLAWLAGFGGVILADCGTGLLDPPTRAALEAADQIVLVTDSAADTARLVVEAGRQLPAGRPRWLVANKVPSRGARVDLGSVRADLPDLAGSVVLPAVDLAVNVLTPRFRWEHAPRAWRAPVRELAAGLSAGWAGA